MPRQFVDLSAAFSRRSEQDGTYPTECIVNPKNILVIGAGKIGQVVADLLAGTSDYDVTLADRDAAALDMLAASAMPGSRVRRVTLDVADDAALRRALDDRFAVLSAAPFHFTQRVA